MHKKIIKMGIILALCVCAFNVKGVYAQEVKVGTHLEHEYDISVVRRATEHTDGERLYKCKICGESHVETIEATGHIWSEWIVDVSPTETKEGHRYRVCTKYPEHPHYQEEVITALLSIHKSANTAKTVYTAFKKHDKTDNTNKNDLKKDNISETQPYKNDDRSESRANAVEPKSVEASKSVTEQPAIRAANVAADAAVAMYSDINALDVCAGVGAIAISWWYVYVLKPMVDALMWIKRKRSAMEKKLYLSK